MAKDKLKGLIALSVLLAIVGLFLLFNSVNLGTSLAERWLAAEGGADTSWFHIRATGNINSFLAAGGIFLTIGLTTTIFAFYKFFSVKE